VLYSGHSLHTCTQSVLFHCYPLGSSLDVSVEMVVEGDWLLSAQRSSVQPKMTIVCTPLPADGDYNEYVTAGI